MSEFDEVLYLLSGLVLMMVIIRIYIPSYRILNIKIIESNESYYTIEALIKDERFFLKWRKPYKKVFLCSNKTNRFFLKYKGSNKTLYGYSEETFESCILDYKANNKL
ncbi:MAG: hypothetical protein ACPGSD_17680 [Flavobacteriales bacterium]|jgi:hypothetical protein